MIYSVGTQQLNVPETDGKSPRQAVGWRDIAESCRTLDAVCQYIPFPVHQAHRAADAIAKVGFWAAVFRNVWPDCELVLNEEDRGARTILRANFPDALLSRENPQTWTPPECDVGLFDADHFTLKSLDQWEGSLARWAERCVHLIVSDGACYGFKFGNLSRYGVETPEGYYQLLARALHKATGKHVTHVSKFENAAAILLGPEPAESITYLSPSFMKLARGGRAYQAALPPQGGLWD